MLTPALIWHWRSFPQRVHAALPQIQSLNPLVKVTPIPTASPFITAEGEAPSTEDEMDAFIKKEGIDIVCVTDASKDDMVSIIPLQTTFEALEG